MVWDSRAAPQTPADGLTCARPIEASWASRVVDTVRLVASALADMRVAGQPGLMSAANCTGCAAPWPVVDGRSVTRIRASVPTRGCESAGLHYAPLRRGLRIVTRKRRRGSVPSSNSSTPTISNPAASCSTFARSKKWMMNPWFSYRASPRWMPRPKSGSAVFRAV